MGDNSILITSSDVTLDEIKAMSTPALEFSRLDAKALSFLDSDSFIIILDGGPVLDEYEEYEKELILQLIPTPRLFIIDTNRFKLLIKFQDSISKEIFALVDNDYGRISEVSTVLKFANESEYRGETET